MIKIILISIKILLKQLNYLFFVLPNKNTQSIHLLFLNLHSIFTNFITEFKILLWISLILLLDFECFEFLRIIF